MEVSKKIKFLGGVAEVAISAKRTNENVKPELVEVCILHSEPNAVLNHLFKNPSNPERVFSKLFSQMLVSMFDLTFKRLNDEVLIETVMRNNVGVMHIHAQVWVESPVWPHLDSTSAVDELLSSCNIKTVDHES